MSLKAFHIVFIGASILLALGFAWWCLRDYRAEGRVLDLAYGAGSLLVAVALGIYGRLFLKKLKRVAYL